MSHDSSSYPQRRGVDREKDASRVRTTDTNPETDLVRIDIESADGDRDSVELPREALALLAEGNAPASAVVGDLAVFGCMQRIYTAVNESEGDVSPRVEVLEARLSVLFEERFGVPFEDVFIEESLADD